MVYPYRKHRQMNLTLSPAELKARLAIKSSELEKGLEEGRQHAELLGLYKEIKELQYQLTMASINAEFQS